MGRTKPGVGRARRKGPCAALPRGRNGADAAQRPRGFRGGGAGPPRGDVLLQALEGEAEGVGLVHDLLGPVLHRRQTLLRGSAALRPTACWRSRRSRRCHSPRCGGTARNPMRNTGARPLLALQRQIGAASSPSETQSGLAPPPLPPLKRGEALGGASAVRRACAAPRNPTSARIGRRWPTSGQVRTKCC